MTEVTLDPAARMLRLVLDDAAEARFPYLWLRDNCPTAWHPDTAERVLDLLEVPDDAAPEAARIEGDALVIDWRADGAGHRHRSRFPLAWLAAHRPGQGLADPADLPRIAWPEGMTADGIPRGDAAALMADDGAFARWLADLRGHGLALVTGLGASAEAGMALARRIGHLRETNFGLTFEVRSKPNPNNLAYTAEALPLHTDLPNQEMPPGFQFLHCLENGAEGGGSVFADGIAIAEALAARDPAAFETLATTPIPFRFHDAGCDIRSHRPVIERDATGAVVEIRYNAHIAGVLDLVPERIEPWYRAYRAFMALTRAPAFRVELRLAAGEMAVFDNRRILHGRAAFDPATGRRHLHGCYVDRGEVDSRLRVLARGGARLAAE